MKERGILFSAPMVRALLAGAKTQTRRIVKLPKWLEECGGKSEEAFANKAFGVTPCLNVPWDEDRGAIGRERMWERVRNPWGWPEPVRLWVRETHAQFSVGNRERNAPQCVAYRATCDADGSFDYVNNGDEVMHLKVTKWTPSLLMPRWASRITLEVTEVRVERLQDISEEDAKAEGVEPDADCLANRCRRPYFDRYLDLWDEINGKGSWKANPWVWVVAFKRLQP